MVNPCFGCILLLNGWQPLPLGERAILADVVVSADCIQTFKELRTEDANTYFALFHIKDVIKGQNIISDIKTSQDDFCNVTNFGDKTMCYSDVSEGESYLLFLTVFEGGLSAKYDDLFGAVTDQTTANEEEILTALGE